MQNAIRNFGIVVLAAYLGTSSAAGGPARLGGPLRPHPPLPVGAPSPAAAGEGLGVRGAAALGAPVTIEYYYKLVPGAMTPGGSGEWLALYLKNHNPILKQLTKEGLIKSEKLYERRFHGAAPSWDYKVVMVWRDWAALEEAQAREPEIISSLYPNKAEHDRQEKRRWELTESHWDDVLKEVPLE